MWGKQEFKNAARELAGCAVLVAGMLTLYSGTRALAEAAQARHIPISVTAPISVATDFGVTLAVVGSLSSERPSRFAKLLFGRHFMSSEC
jgi:hypothetical protein